MASTFRAARASGVPLVFDERYGQDLPPEAHDPCRAANILAFLLQRKLVRSRQVHRPRQIPMCALRSVHTDPYLDSLEQPGGWVPVLGRASQERELARLLELHRRMVGGTTLAAALARRRGGTAIHLGGGLHHASADRGQGFCVFNDVAVAVAEQRRHGLAGEVLVIDLDLHDGDGTRAIFARDPTVHTFSIHNHDLGSREAVASTSVALGAGVDDARYLAALREHLPPMVERVRPELVFFLGGSDPAADDALGDWCVTANGLVERDRLVLSLLDGAPLVYLTAGGYGPGAWRHGARCLSAWLDGGRVAEPPDDDTLLLERYRRSAQRLSAADLTREPTSSWTLTDEDVLGSLGSPGGGTPPSRVLGYYTRHGVELALERYGVLERLRARGFAQPRVRVETGGGAGDTIRVLSDSCPGEPLVELRLRRDPRALPGAELLHVDWLLLQDPRARFAPEQPALPGQRHPGLGMLRDVVALLVIVCERLGLDGLAFLPSHYHLAAQSRRLLRFADPEDEARFRALRRVLQPLPLAAAARAVDSGSVIEPAAGGARFVWEPRLMAIPVSPALRTRIAGPGYERRVAAAARRFAFALESDSA